MKEGFALYIIQLQNRMPKAGGNPPVVLTFHH